MRVSLGMAPALVALCLLGGALAPGASTAGAAPVTATRLAVGSDHVWTSTGVQVRAGETVTIRATGRMRFGAPPIDRLTPVGVRRGSTCEVIGGSRTAGWPASDLNCWSLIARVGASHPFAVGRARSIRIAKSGELQLGINDNHLEDNSGAWAATVTVTPVATPPAPPATPTTASPARAKSASSLPLILTVAVAALVLLAVVVVFLRRRRRGENEEPLSAVVAGRGPAPEPEPVGPGDSTVGNFLDVDFAGGGQLSVDYNHFPEDTVVSWSATCVGSQPSSGEFVTEGGGEARHAVTIPVGAPEWGGRAADLSFTWTVAGVPFRYAVRRNVPAEVRPLR